MKGTDKPVICTGKRDFIQTFLQPLLIYIYTSLNACIGPCYGSYRYGGKVCTRCTQAAIGVRSGCARFSDGI